MGFYATHEFCKEIIDKFVEYFKKNANKIIDNNIFDDDIDIIQIKTWCISLFDINIKFNENINLSLKIQKI